MFKLPVLSVLRLVFERNAIRFLLGTILSLAFSIAVILSTIGLMDGFVLSLKKSLAFSNGDVKMTSRKGFFLYDETFEADFYKNNSVQSLTPILQIESFAITDLGSKGVLIKGIKPQEFSTITGLKLNDLKEGVAIGKKFAQTQSLKVGDVLTLALASSKEKNQGVALLQDVTVKAVVEHGIFEKDMRFIYMPRDELEDILGYKSGVSNLVYFKLKNLSHLDQTIDELNKSSPEYFRFEPYWSEFDVLLDAVQIEKKSISLMLQLIVMVAILNIVGFLIYISEIKAQDFFMLRALGLSLKKLEKFWIGTLLFIWLGAAGVAYLLVELFGYLITVIPYLKIPGDIYVLSELQVELDSFDYILVYGLSLLWVMIVGIIVLKRLNKQTVISGLRQEFS
ncbi:MAG: hypothetical protein CME62_16010 [Halobacteriovoraceae bacterium]|nr:hypothetical protein [Halobacteriovoraceae bacterium]|tara:strand:+ start:1088 stop:2272 length:1185 start_codon:yes stop_codon:yes gene_type:complete